MKSVAFKYIKIKQKIIIIFSILFLTISFSVYFYFSSNFGSILIQSFSDNLDRHISDISVKIDNDFFEDSKSRLKFLNEMNNEKDLIYLILKDEKGKIIFNYNLNKASIVQYEFSDEKFQRNDSIYKTFFPVFKNNIKKGVIYAGFSLNKLDQTLRSKRRNTVFLCIFIFILGMFTVFLSNYIVSAPLKNLVSLEKEIEKNKYLSQKSFISSDEIGELGSIFKKMVENLEKAYNEVENVNSELENRVTERTELLQQEINEHKLTVAKLHKSEIKLRALLNGIPDLMFVFSKEGYFLDYKSESAKNFLKSTGKVVGKYIYDVFPKNIASDLLSNIQKTIESEKPQFLEYQLDINGQKRLYEALFVFIDCNEVLAIIRDITERKLSEMVLIESESKFRLLAETIPSAIFVFSGSNFIYSNPGTEVLTGYSNRELLEMNYWDFVHPDYRDEVKQRGLACLKGKEIIEHFEFPIIHKCGEPKWIEYAGKYYDNRGKTAVIGIAIDITERMKASEKIRKLSLAVENSPAMIVITDILGNMEYVNPKFSSVTGYSLDELYGKNPRIFKSGLTSKEEYENLWKTIKTGNVWKGEFLNKKKNGELFWESNSISCIKNSKGEITHFLGIKEDITEQKLIEEKLIQSERDYRGLFEYAHDAIIIFNPASDKILNSNPSASRIFGLSKNEIEKSSFAKLWPDAESKVGLITNVQKNYLVKNFEIVFLKPDNSKLYLELNATVIHYKGEKAVMIIFRDISERKKFEVKLIEAKENAECSEKLKTEFLTRMSHEIRTPVNTILSYSWLLKDELENKVSDDLKLAFKSIDEGGRRLIRTIDQILNMSQIQAGSYDISIAKIDIVDNVLNTLRREFLNQVKQKGLEINILKNTIDSVIPVDFDTVTQIFSNLIDNAIKFTDKGKIDIRVYTEGEETLVVEVSDTGVGISSEFMPHLFSPFSQEEGGYTRSYEGNGLGLALVKKYVDMNNAAIEVNSEKGKGTTFKVIFNRNLV